MPASSINSTMPGSMPGVVGLSRSPSSLAIVSAGMAVAGLVPGVAGDPQCGGLAAAGLGVDQLDAIAAGDQRTDHRRLLVAENRPTQLAMVDLGRPGWAVRGEDLV